MLGSFGGSETLTTEGLRVSSGYHLSQRMKVSIINRQIDISVSHIIFLSPKMYKPTLMNDPAKQLT